MATLVFPRGNGIKIRPLQDEGTIMHGKIVEDAIFYNDQDECGDFYPVYKQPILCDGVSKFQYFFDGVESTMVTVRDENGDQIGSFPAIEYIPNYFFVTVDWSTIPNLCTMDCVFLIVETAASGSQLLSNQSFNAGLTDWDNVGSGQDWVAGGTTADISITADTPGESKVLKQDIAIPESTGLLINYRIEVPGGDISIFKIDIYINYGEANEKLIHTAEPPLINNTNFEYINDVDIVNVGFKISWVTNPLSFTFEMLRFRIFDEFDIQARSEPLMPTNDKLCTKTITAWCNDLAALNMRFPTEIFAQLTPSVLQDNFTQEGPGEAWSFFPGTYSYTVPRGIAASSSLLTAEATFRKGITYRAIVWWSASINANLTVRIVADVGETTETVILTRDFIDPAGVQIIEFDFTPERDYYSIGFGSDVNSSTGAGTITQNFFLMGIFPIWSQTYFVDATLRETNLREQNRVFTDSAGNELKISSRASKSNLLTTDYMPPYMYEILHILAQCDIFYIETVNHNVPIQYTKESEMRLTHPKRYSLSMVNMELTLSQYNERNDNCS